MEDLLWGRPWANNPLLCSIDRTKEADDGGKDNVKGCQAFGLVSLMHSGMIAIYVLFPFKCHIINPKF